MLETPPPRSHCAGASLAALALVLAALGAWANSFSGPFVFDDRPAILANPTLASFSTALFPPRDGGTVAGRPLVNLTFALNRAIGGTEVWSYHALNLAIHVLAGLTLFGLGRRTLLRWRAPAKDPADASAAATRVAFAAALLWIVHPLQTAAVTYVVQRAESLMALFFLLTLYAFARAADAASPARARGWLAVSAAACFAGMACKEVMVVAPLVVLLYDRTFVARRFRPAWRGRAGYYAALAASWLLLAWLVVANDARAGTAGFGTAIPPLDYALTQAAGIVRYLRLVVWPDSLVFDYGTAVETRLGDVWPQVLLLVVFVAAITFLLRRAPAWGFLGATFFLVLVPSSSVLPVATQTLAEHRMYLPLAAIAVALAAVLHAALSRRMLFVVLPVAVLLGAATFRRNADYRDALTLWSDTVEKRPGNSRARNQLGVELARAKRPAEAVPHFEAALAALPGDAEAHNNLGNALQELGRPAEALRHFEQSVQLKPGSDGAQRSLAHALLQAGQPGRAAEHFEAAERLAPLDAASLASLGTALLQTNRLPAAIERYRQAVRLDPGQPRTHYNLGLALARTSQLAPAAEALSEAVRLEPGYLAARVNFGNVLLLANRPAEAIAQYEAALQLKPDDGQIRANLARAQALARRARP